MERSSNDSSDGECLGRSRVFEDILTNDAVRRVQSGDGVVPGGEADTGEIGSGAVVRGGHGVEDFVRGVRDESLPSTGAELEDDTEDDEQKRSESGHREREKVSR